MTAKIRAAVIGVGHLGRYHAQKYAALEQCELVAVVDSDPLRRREVSQELGVPGVAAVEEVLPLVDAVSIATPTSTHHAVGSACLEAGKHTLIEKPLTATAEEGEALVNLARKNGIVLQVGYLERFNPAFAVCAPQITRPQFIEALRISPYQGRGDDVDVVLDLMSHDIDLVLSMVDAPLRDLHAVGISILTPSTDLANARLIFENGAVANLTASRISTKGERTIRLFQPDRYFSLDLSAPSARQFSAGAGEEQLTVEKGDALLLEIEAFLDSIAQGTPPAVSGEQGLHVMNVAGRIMEDISRNILP